MAREAPVKSGNDSPIPLQKSFIPPPVPVDSTIGEGDPVKLENSSATAWVYGNTVDDPTMLIWSRAETEIAPHISIDVDIRIVKNLIYILLLNRDNNLERQLLFLYFDYDEEILNFYETLNCKD